jgi:hypothetical protein
MMVPSRCSFRPRDGARSFPIAIIVATLLSLSPVAVLLSDGPQIKGSTRIAAAQEAGDVIEFQPGVTVTVLGSEAVDSLPNEGRSQVLMLDRVPLPPGTTMSDVLADLADQPGVPDYDVDGLRLLYVDAGELVVLSDSGETTFQHGAQLLIPSGTDFDVRNDTSRCASFLLLTVWTKEGAGLFGSSVEGPSLPDIEDCPTPRRWIGWEASPQFSGPARLFLARALWDPADYVLDRPQIGVGPIAHFGPVGFVVETGTLNVREWDEDIHVYLAPGSYVWIWPATLYSVLYQNFDENAESATALLVGVVPDDGPWYLPLDFVSSANGFGLTWDNSWEETGQWRSTEGSFPNFDRYHGLRLANGTSEVLFEDFAGYEGDPGRCLDDQINNLQADPNVTELRPMLPDEVVVEERDVTGGASAQYSYSITDPDGTTRELVRYMECRTIVAGEAVLTINAWIPAADYEVEIQALDRLLDGLVLPPG